MFAKFALRYGAKWTSQFDDEMWPAVQAEWLDILGNLELMDIKRGLDNWREDWPPNVMEFAKACKPPTETPALPMYREWETPRLPPRVDKETAKANLAKLRNILNGAVK